MKTELINETGFENKELIAQMIRAAEYAAQTVTGTDRLEVGLTLTDPDSIRELNREYRGVDAVTDVLSFPLMEFEKGAEGRVDPEDEDAVDPDTGLIMLGDIVINMERVFSQAEEYGHSPEREGLLSVRAFRAAPAGLGPYGAGGQKGDAAAGGKADGGPGA